MSRSHKDDEGIFYKRLSSHQPLKYDGEPDPVCFEDWIEEMARFATKIVISDRGKAIRFFEGLNLRIQKGTPRYQDFNDMYNQALEYERILEKEDEFNKRKNESSGGGRYKKAKSGGKKPFQTVARPTQ